VNSVIKESLKEHLDVMNKSLSIELVDVLEKMTSAVIDALKKGNKILLFGNGGSAADAQHVAAEFIGRFQKERKALPAIALTADICNLTCLANDYGYENVFSRQIEALGKKGDVSIGFTTSGSSKNVILAQEKAKRMGITAMAFTGQKDSPLEKICDLVYKAPSYNTARIQECHITAAHILCQLAESSLFKDEK
jgi:D-sedoheptulose 7-phosphate isomerase